MAKPVYKPSQILRMVRAKKIADPQPRGEGKILCERKHHRVVGDTESPTFWENGMYSYCEGCKGWALSRIEFKDFIIDLRGERKKYPLAMP